MKYTYSYRSKIGIINFIEEKGAITSLSLERAGEEEKEENGVEVRCTPVIQEAWNQVEAYFKGKRKTFDFPMNLKGTPFQRQVWEALQEIPYGKTCSYKEIAIRIGRPKACRAVGMANNKNPIPIAIPCHRVVGADGKLVGYAYGLEIKEWLLELERTSMCE